MQRYGVLSDLFGISRGLTIAGGLGILALDAGICLALFLIAGLLAAPHAGLRGAGLALAAFDAALAIWAPVSIVIRVAKGKSPEEAPLIRPQRHAPPPPTNFGPRTIRKSALKQTLVLIGCAALAFGSLQIVRDPAIQNHTAGWVGLVLFGAGGVLFFILSLTSNGGLLLDEDGFTLASPLRIRRYAWTDVSEFAVVKIGRAGSQMIGFSVLNQTSALQSFNQAALGAGAAIANAYVLSPRDLAALMNQYRANALQYRRPATERILGQPEPRPAFGRLVR